MGKGSPTKGRPSLKSFGVGRGDVFDARVSPAQARRAAASTAELSQVSSVSHLIQMWVAEQRQSLKREANWAAQVALLEEVRPCRVPSWLPWLRVAT